MDVESWRDNLLGVTLNLQHITPDEVPSVVARIGSKDTIAKIVAEYSAEDAKYILRIDGAIYEAIVDYVKPRWPELF